MTAIPTGRATGPLPVVRVDNWLLWPGGYARVMSRRERFAWWLGWRGTPQQ